MKIRKASKKDSVKISNLIDKSLNEVNSKDYTKKQISILRSKNNPKRVIEKLKERSIFVLEKNNKIIGTVDINLKKRIIGGFYINPKFIGKGLGKKLLDFIENYAKKKRIRKLKLYSTKTALGFYKKYGYKIIKKEKWEPQKGVIFPIIIMNKWIK
jgi:N-acetylglutamate synthase-like GNAT family acetyltransferase